MKSLKVFLLGMLCVNLSYAQNETDALRYSNLNYFGTARFMGVGGAMSAYGKDMSSITLNPAGQAGFNWSEFSFTGNVTGTGINTSYNGTNSSDMKGNFNFSNIGVVFAIKQNPDKITNWRKMQFGYSRTRTNDFVGRTVIKGNHDNSMLHSFVNRGNTGGENGGFISPNNLSADYERIVFDALLIDTVNNKYEAYTSSTNIDQEKITNTTGYQFANDITFSANYNNKLYVGGSIGFPSSRYNSVSNYTERFKDDTTKDLEKFTFQENINTTGSGLNAKIGLIYMPVKFIRVGLAVHSATYYSMTDKFQNIVTSEFTDDQWNRRIESEKKTYNYSIKTPARYLASFAYLYKKRGVFSLEYEYVDYKSAKLSADEENFDLENNKIKEIYKGASVIKVGAEFRVTNNWTVRAGAAHYGSPIKSDATTVANTRKNFSGGLGYKTKKFSLDFAYVRSMTSSSTYLYDPAYTNPTTVDKNINNFVVTAGFRF